MKERTTIEGIHARCGDVVGTTARRVRDFWWSHRICDVVCAVVVALVVMGLTPASFPSAAAIPPCLVVGIGAIMMYPIVERMSMAFHVDPATGDLQRGGDGVGTTWMAVYREMVVGLYAAIVVTLFAMTGVMPSPVALGVAVGAIVLEVLAMDRALDLHTEAMRTPATSDIRSNCEELSNDSPRKDGREQRNPI